MTIDDQFNRLTEKLHLLSRTVSRLQRENDKLREDLLQAQQNEATAQQKVKDLEQQAAILKFAAGDMNEKDKKDFEKTINQYIREIDKCISFLSQ